MAVMQSPTKALLPKSASNEDTESPLISEKKQDEMYEKVYDLIRRNIETAIEYSIIVSANSVMKKYEKQYGDSVWEYLELEPIEEDMHVISDDKIEECFKELRRENGIEE